MDLPKNYNDCFSFEYITEDSQLIYPSIYNEIITNKKIEENEINNFNCFLKKNFGQHLYNLIKPLNLQLIKNIPIEIISKYYVCAYSSESHFYRILNYDLMLFKGEKYYPFIKTLYKGMNYYNYKDLKTPLYRGTTLSDCEINKLKEVLNNKSKYDNDESGIENAIPKVLFYSRAFLSFSKKKEIAMGFNGNVLLELQLNHLNINDIQSNACIEKFSEYSNEEEVLFYPYSSFSIENMPKQLIIFAINIKMILKISKRKQVVIQIFINK